MRLDDEKQNDGRDISRELAFHLGVTRGILSCLLRDKAALAWFEKRHCLFQDLMNLEMASNVVAKAFYQEPK